MSAKKLDPNSVWVGFDLGGTKMLATVFDDTFRVLGRRRKRTQGSKGADEGLERIITTIRDALEDAKVDTESLLGIGVGSAGPLNPQKGILLDAPNLGWTRVKIGQHLRETFHCPVILANDVDAGVYGEYRFGAGQKASTVVGIFPGTGIGGGCVINNEILMGKSRSCMEIGHIPVMPNGPLCGCGQRGCLEAVGSRLAIAAAAAAAAYRGEAPNLLAKAGTEISEIRSGVIAAAIADGDKVVEEIVRNAARWVGIGVATLVNLMAPQVVVLGGGLVEALPDLYVEEVTAAAASRVMTPYRKTFHIRIAELGDDAVVQGAAAWAQHQVLGSAHV